MLPFLSYLWKFLELVPSRTVKLSYVKMAKAVVMCSLSRLYLRPLLRKTRIILIRHATWSSRSSH